MIEELVLLAAVLGLIWKSQRATPIRGEMCNQGVCETRTTRSVPPPEQQILLDTPVNTTGRDDTLAVSGCDMNAILKIRRSVLAANEEAANNNSGVALGSPAVI